MNPEINVRFKHVRDVLRLKQNVFADTLGISRSYIGSMETGVVGISANAMVTLHDKLGVSLDWLVSGKGKMFLPIGDNENAPLENALHITANVLKDNANSSASRLSYDAPKLPTPEHVKTDKELTEMDTQELRMQVVNVEEKLEEAIRDLERRYKMIEARDRALDEREALLDRLIDKMADKIGFKKE